MGRRNARDVAFVLDFFSLSSNQYLQLTNLNRANMTAHLSSGTKFKGNRLNSRSTPAARANAEKQHLRLRDTEAPSSRASRSPTSPHLQNIPVHSTSSPHRPTAPQIPRRDFLKCGERPPERGRTRGTSGRLRGFAVGGCERRSATYWVSWMSVSSALVRISGVDSRYVNARFQIWAGRSASRLSMSVNQGSFLMAKGRWVRILQGEAWPRALSQYGASWARNFDG